MPWHGSRMLRNDCIKNLDLWKRRAKTDSNSVGNLSTNRIRLKAE